MLSVCYRNFQCDFSFDSLTGNRSVKPGGWVKFQDWGLHIISPDGSLDGTGLQQYHDEVNSAFEEAGYEIRPGVNVEQWFKDAGFVNIHVEKFVISYGVWSKDPHLVSLRPLPPNRNQVMIDCSPLRAEETRCLGADRGRSEQF